MKIKASGYVEINSQLISAEVRCGNCELPTYNKINQSETYQVLMLEFMRRGGDDYKFISNLPFTNLGKYEQKNFKY